MQEHTFQRVVLNAHPGSTNVIPKSEMDVMMRRTFRHIVETLLDHCGPKSGFAMIVDMTDPTVPPLFTKDGINIVRAIEFISPMQKIIRDELAHIGQHMEKTVGDGTTTAMIVCALTYLNLIELAKFNVENISFQELRDLYGRFSDACKKKLVRYVITVDKYKELFSVDTATAIKKIAYYQALTSSHGDHELASMAADIFTGMPEEAWDKITFIRQSVETDKRVDLKCVDDNYILTSRPLFDKYLNAKGGTAFHQDKCCLIVANSVMFESDIVTMKIFQLAKEYSDNGEHMVIICPNGMDDYLVNQLNAVNDKNLSIFVVPVNQYDFNDLTGLQCVAGVSRINVPDDITVISNVTVDYNNHELRINGLYPEDKENIIHPSVKDPDSALSKFLKDLDAVISVRETENVTNSQLMKDLQSLKTLYNKVKYTRRYTVFIGGSARDNSHTFDLVSDVLFAVKSSLKHGFTPACNLALLDVCSELTCAYVTKDHTSNLHRLGQLSAAFHVALVRIKDFVQPEHDLDHITPWNSDEFDQGRVKKYLNEQTCPAIQPATVETTILDKFEDVILKYIYTSKIIVPGGIYKVPEKPSKMTL